MERFSVLHRSAIAAVFVVFLSEGEGLTLALTAITGTQSSDYKSAGVSSKFVSKVVLVVRMDELSFEMITPEVF